MARTVYRVFVDESGVRAHGPKTSEHFVMSACIVPNARKADLLATLAQIRIDLGQPAGHTIAFKNLSHQSRLHLAKKLGAVPYLTISNVIVCKRELPVAMSDVDAAYLYTLRYLLERVTWFVDDHGGQAYVTFAHIDRFKIMKLHSYIGILRADPSVQIRWQALFLPVRMETMQGNDFLQVADATASSAAQAFEPDRHGNVEPGYLQALRPRLYRRGRGAITSYGMKLHPTAMATDSRYLWVGQL